MKKMNGEHFARLAKLMRYLIAGAVGATVNLGTFAFLIGVAKVWYLSASIIAFCCSVVVSFLMQKYWTFRNRHAGATKRQAILFLTVSLCNLCLNTALVFCFVQLADLPKFWSQVAAAIVVAIGSYFLYKHIVFSHTDDRQPNSGHPRRLHPRYLRERFNEFAAQYRTAILLFLGALIVRLAVFIFFYWWFVMSGHAPGGFSGYGSVFPIPAGDSQEYTQLAIRLLSSHVYSLSTHAPWFPESFRLPGYPWLLAGLMAIGFGSGKTGLVGIALLQLMLSSATVLLTYLIGRRFLPEQAAIIAGVLMIIEPSSVFYSAFLDSDTLFVFLIMLAVYLMFLPTTKTKPKSYGRAILLGASVGALIGYAVLVRVIGEFLPFVLIAFCLLAYYLQRKRFSLADLMRWSALVIAFLAVIAPWAVRDHKFFGTYTLSSTSDVNFVRYTIPMYYASTHGMSADAAMNLFLAKLPYGNGTDGNPADPFVLRSLENHAASNQIIHQYLLPHLPSYTVFSLIKTIPFYITDGLRDMNTVVGLLPVSNAVQASAPPNFTGMLIHGDFRGIVKNLTALNTDTTLLFIGSSFWILICLLDIGVFISLSWKMLKEWKNHQEWYLVFFCMVMALYFGILTGPVSEHRYRMPAAPFMFLGAAYGAWLIWVWFKNRPMIR